jgi:hypothetical protein
LVKYGERDYFADADSDTNANPMRYAATMSFVLLPLRKFALGSAISAILGVTIGSVTMQQVFGQASAYLVTELSSEDAGAVPSKLNNLGDMAGSAASAAEGGTRATIWSHSDLKKKHLRAWLGSDYSSASAINVFVNTNSGEMISGAIGIVHVVTEPTSSGPAT